MNRTSVAGVSVGVLAACLVTGCTASHDDGSAEIASVVSSISPRTTIPSCTSMVNQVGLTLPEAMDAGATTDQYFIGTQVEAPPNTPYGAAGGKTGHWNIPVGGGVHATGHIVEDFTYFMWLVCTQDGVNYPGGACPAGQDGCDEMSIWKTMNTGGVTRMGITSVNCGSGNTALVNSWVQNAVTNPTPNPNTRTPLNGNYFLETNYPACAGFLANPGPGLAPYSLNALADCFNAIAYEESGNTQWFLNLEVNQSYQCGPGTYPFVVDYDPWTGSQR